MINFIKKLFSKPKSSTYRLFFIDNDSRDEVDLGEYEGDVDDAWNECQLRMVNYVFTSGTRAAVVGTYGVERVKR